MLCYVGGFLEDEKLFLMFVLRSMTAIRETTIDTAIGDRYFFQDIKITATTVNENSLKKALDKSPLFCNDSRM